MMLTYEGVLNGSDGTDAATVSLGREPHSHIAVLRGILKHQVLQRARGREEVRPLRTQKVEDTKVFTNRVPLQWEDVSSASKQCSQRVSFFIPA